MSSKTDSSVQANIIQENCFRTLKNKPKLHGKTKRICIDPRNLNQPINQPHYATLATEEILVKMEGAKRFTKLDASNAY